MQDVGCTCNVPAPCQPGIPDGSLLGGPPTAVENSNSEARTPMAAAAAFDGSTPSSAPETPGVSSPKSFAASAASSSAADDESGGALTPLSDFASAASAAFAASTETETEDAALLLSARRAAREASLAQTKFGPLRAAAQALSPCRRADLASLCGLLQQRRRERMRPDDCFFAEAAGGVSTSASKPEELGEEALYVRRLLRALSSKGLLRRPPPLSSAATRAATQRLLLHRLVSELPPREEAIGEEGSACDEEDAKEAPPPTAAAPLSLLERLQKIPLRRDPAARLDGGEAAVERKALAFVQLVVEEAKKRSVDFPRLLPALPPEEAADDESGGPSRIDLEKASAKQDGRKAQQAFPTGGVKPLEKKGAAAECLAGPSSFSPSQRRTRNHRRLRLSRLREKLHLALLELSSLREAAGEAELLLEEMKFQTQKALAAGRALGKAALSGGSFEGEENKLSFETAPPSESAAALLLRREASLLRAGEETGKTEEASQERDDEAQEDADPYEGSQGVERLMRSYYEGLTRQLNKRPPAVPLNYSAATPSGGFGSGEDKFAAFAEEPCASLSAAAPPAASPAETVFFDPFSVASVVRTPSARSLSAAFSEASPASLDEARRGLQTTNNGLNGVFSSGGGAGLDGTAALSSSQQSAAPQHSPANSPSGTGVEKVKGVAFCRSNRYWMCSKMENGKQQCRYFSVKQLGFESARRQAILLRQQWKGDVSEEVLRALNEDSCATPTEGRAEAAETAGAEDSQSECPLTLLEETSCCGASRGKGLQESPALQKELILSRVANSSGFAVAENLGTSDLAPGRRAAATAFAASVQPQAKRKRLNAAARQVVVDRSGVIPRPPAEFDFGSDTDFLTENEEDREEESLAMDPTFLALHSAELNSQEPAAVSSVATEASAEGAAGSGAGADVEQQRRREIAEKCLLGASTTADALVVLSRRLTHAVKIPGISFHKGVESWLCSWKEPDARSAFPIFVRALERCVVALKAFAAIKQIKRRRREAKLHAEGLHQPGFLARPSDQETDVGASTPPLSPQPLQLPVSGESTVAQPSGTVTSFDVDILAGREDSPAPGDISPDLEVSQGLTPVASSTAAPGEQHRSVGLNSVTSCEFADSGSFGTGHVADATACLGSQTGEAAAVSQADLATMVSRQNELLASFTVAEAAARPRCGVASAPGDAHMLTNGFNGGGFVDAQHSQQHLGELQQMHQHLHLCSDGSRQETNGDGFLEGDPGSVALS